MSVEVRVWHRVLGMTVAECRRTSGLTTRQAASRLGMSTATLNRSENALRPFDPVEVGAALAVYQVTGADRAQVLALADGPRPHGWWEMAAMSEVHEQAVMMVERRARSVIEFSATEIPPVAQTPHYTQAMWWNRLPETRAALVRAKDRQKILLYPTRPERTLILDEAVLRRPVGGPTAMAQQLRHLLALVRGRSITVRVIPFKEGGYRSPGNCAVYRITTRPSVIHLWSDAASGLLDDPADTEAVEKSVVDLLSIAAAPSQSADLLSRIATDHERTAGLYP